MRKNTEDLTQKSLTEISPTLINLYSTQLLTDEDNKEEEKKSIGRHNYKAKFFDIHSNNTTGAVQCDES